MRSLTRWIGRLILPLLFACSTYAGAATVVMAFGEKIPPFCFPESDSGIELEVIGEALAFRGHQLEPRYFPLARVPLAFRRGEVDAAMTDLGQDLSDAGAHYGNPAVIYYNVFVSLKGRHLSIKKPEDIKGLSVVAFQGAAQRYPEWLAASQKDGLYFEQNNQELQVLGLNKARYDLVLSDRSIFRYFELLLERTTLFKAKSTEMHQFVEEDPQNYRPVFRDPQIRDDFNAGLAQLKASGRYQAIYDHYLEQK
ncbi:substrate-binding periplasmic protein [Pseudomonas sp.]|uniref:substrate-binding periplasmic protein n=1 Tax=Pseudomonas sp. TaxID=306 RepID=UPI003C70D432